MCTEAPRVLTFPLRFDYGGDYGHVTVRLNTPYSHSQATTSPLIVSPILSVYYCLLSVCPGEVAREQGDVLRKAQDQSKAGSHMMWAAYETAND